MQSHSNLMKDYVEVYHELDFFEFCICLTVGV